MNHLVDEDLIKEFVADSLEHLGAVEPDLLAIEKGEADISPDIINRVFRTVHNIKGASGIFGFESIKELSHVMENLLMKIRDGNVSPDSDRIDALLAGVDKLRIMIVALQTGADEPAFEEELDRLRKILTNTPRRTEGRSCPQPPESVPFSKTNRKDNTIRLRAEGYPLFGTADFEVSREDMATVMGMPLYAVWVHLYEDLVALDRMPEDFMAHIESFGRCLASNVQADFSDAVQQRIPEQNDVYTFLLATDREPDLLCRELKIPGEQLYLFNPDTMDNFACDGISKKVPPEPSKAFAKDSGEQAPANAVSGARVSGPETIRVNVGLLDTLMNLAGELVLGRNQLRQMLEGAVYENPKLGTIMQNVNLITSELQEHIVQMRMQPLGNILNKFQRVVRDLARQLSKEVELVVEGEEVELDKSILEGISDPLNHLIRNCVDHAVESPEERIKLGKPLSGLIRLKAFHEGGQVNITVADDGRGIDTEAVVEKAVGKGILNVDEARRMSEKEKLNLIFLPGFSTATVVTDVSGRGVGMDVVKTNIENLGGHVTIDSASGVGTTVWIRLPLTLAIIPSLIVRAGPCRFAIPQVNVRELVCIQASDAARRIEKVGAADVLRLRERLLPLVRLTDVLGMYPVSVDPCIEKENGGMAAGNRKDGGCTGRQNEFGKHITDRHCKRQNDLYVVVLRVGTNGFGLIVDELFDIEEIVVKPLLSHIKDCKCFAGATIMGDGRVAMILDASGIADFTQLRFAEISAEEHRRQEERAKQQKSRVETLRSVLVFNHASHEHFALPLEAIARLEMIDPGTIERIGNRELINYGGEGLPLIRMESILPVGPLPTDAGEMFVIIPKTKEFKVGIMASRIVDIFETGEKIQKDVSTPRGLCGCAVIKGHLTMIVNLDEFLELWGKETCHYRNPPAAKVFGVESLRGLKTYEH